MAENTTLEQQARDLLERAGVENAQSFTAGDLVEIANLLGRVAALAAPVEPVTLTQATAPREIWLQISDDAGDSAEEFPKGTEITWCKDSVLACEVRYVRADLATPPAQPAPIDGFGGNLDSAFDSGPAVPVDMVLHCPACGLQHIDAPDPWVAKYGEELCKAKGFSLWTNPPHKSHLCHGCGHVWRPADVATTGVKAVSTKGKEDGPIKEPMVRQTLSVPALPDKATLDYVTTIEVLRTYIARLESAAPAVPCEHKLAMYNITFTTGTCQNCGAKWTASKGWHAAPAVPAGVEWEYYDMEGIGRVRRRKESAAAPTAQIGMKASTWAALSPDAQNLILEAGQRAVDKTKAQRVTDAAARAAMAPISLDGSAAPAVRESLSAVNRYCAAGMCLPNDKHEAGCATPAVREHDERIRWRDAVIKEAEGALRIAEQEFSDMPTWSNVGHAAKRVTHALAVIAALGITGDSK